MNGSAGELEACFRAARVRSMEHPGREALVFFDDVKGHYGWAWEGRVPAGLGDGDNFQVLHRFKNGKEVFE
jgi:hypothetical protein